ncbi:MFS transporter [Microtetraspora sp. NBRC 13810]|uniref:MFS transporter n=1 Tax=Microtetraspora sp. NBRC 13810 TaxID=3030990 RepID=UPI0024A536F4|nr:MFS transporter [Microtetraspora sp. NBRC 13810]GLW05048.1 MFS transporter [Microtetraspora sp. NBRC 13810]
MTAPTALDAPYAPPRILGPAYRTSTLGILLVTTLIAFEGMSTGVVMPAVSLDLAAIDLYGWSFSAFLMAGLFVNVVAGLWSDRRGHALPFLLGMVVFVAGLGLAGAAETKEVFIAARAVQGAGGGAVIVAIYVMIARVYESAARPKIFALISAAWVVPSLIGPAVAGAVAASVGWRWVFYGIVPLVVPAFVMLLPALRARPGKDRDAPPPATGPRSRPVLMTLAAAATAGGAGVLLYGVDRLHVALTLGLVALACGLAALSAGLPRLLPSGALRLRRGLPTTVAMRGLLCGAFFGVNSYIPLVLHEVRGMSLEGAGLALTTGALGWSAGSYLQSRWQGDRVRLIRYGAAAVTLGVLLASLSALPAVTPWIAVPAWVIAGLGMGAGITSVNVTMLSQSPPQEQGANSAALQVSETLGSSLTIGIGGALINIIGHDDLGTGFLVICMSMALIAVFAVLASTRVTAPAV